MQTGVLPYISVSIFVNSKEKHLFVAMGLGFYIDIVQMSPTLNYGKSLFQYLLLFRFIKAMGSTECGTQMFFSHGFISFRFRLILSSSSTWYEKKRRLFVSTVNSQIHYYNTRNARSFCWPLCRTNTRQFSIYFQGLKFYNSLNSTITGSSSSPSFKRKLKEFLLSMH